MSVGSQFCSVMNSSLGVRRATTSWVLILLLALLAPGLASAQTGSRAVAVRPIPADRILERDAATTIPGVALAKTDGSVTLTLDFNQDDDGRITGAARAALQDQAADDLRKRLRNEGLGARAAGPDPADAIKPGVAYVLLGIVPPHAALRWGFVADRLAVAQSMRALGEDGAPPRGILVPIAVAREVDGEGEPAPGSGNWAPMPEQTAAARVTWFLDNFSEFGAETLEINLRPPPSPPEPAEPAETGCAGPAKTIPTEDLTVPCTRKI